MTTPPKPTIDNDTHNHNHTNDEYYNVITTSPDLEEGIEIPLPLEESVELPLAVFETTIDKNNNDNNDELRFGNASTKMKCGVPLTPTTITSSFSSKEEEDDAFGDDASDSEKYKATSTVWSSWTTYYKIRFLAIVLIVTSLLLLVSFIIYHLVTPNNNNNLSNNNHNNNNTNGNTHFPLAECQGDCDTDDDCDIGLICYQQQRQRNNISYGKTLFECLDGKETVVEVVGDGGEIDYCVKETQQPSENTLQTTTTEAATTAKTTTFTNTDNNPTINHSSSQRPRNRFLFAGQSNMIGHTTSTASITGDDIYWSKLKSILNSASAASTGHGNGSTTTHIDTLEQQLYNVINQANTQKNDTITTHQIATTLTQGVMELYKSSLFNDLDIPLQYGKCSFFEVDDDGVQNVSGGTVPISSMSNCGRSFGHELLFGRTLELLGGGGSSTTMKNNTTAIREEFELVKVARGGSGLYEHWYPNHGLHWDLLKSVIEEERLDQQGQGSSSSSSGGGGGDWKGFIWHQGSQAAWSTFEHGGDRSHTYHGNLTVLVDQVRELMFQNSQTWQCKEEIPVVIVQVGYWPSNRTVPALAGHAAERTRDAQAKFCNQDPRAVLVKTDDLARFFHYDAASFLISGNRIAKAYGEALEGVVECPEMEMETEERVAVPSSSPSSSSALSMEASKSLETTVMRLEADLPSSISTNELV